MDWFDSAAFDDHVGQLLDAWKVAGLSIAIVHGDQTRSKGYGHATFNPDSACTGDTLFDIASCSKSLTAASVATLIEDDEKYSHIQWDSRVSNLLPEDFVMAENSYTQQITVEDVLSHRTGFPDHDDALLSPKAEHPDTPRSVTRNLRNLAISAPLRTQYIYSNIMYTVASYLVEHLSGMSFEDFLHKHFFEPLGMTSSHLQPDAAKAAGLTERMSIPHEWHAEKQTWVALPHEQGSEGQGAGSVWTSVNDYIKYVKAMMNQQGPITEGVYKGVTKLRAFPDPEAVSDENRDPFTSPMAYAAGWEVYNYRGHTVVRHDGAIEGYGSLHLFLPDHNFGCVIFANSNPGQYVVEILGKQLIDEVLHVREHGVDWNARARDADAKSLEKAKEEEAEMRRDICPNGPEPQKLLLSMYTGKYWNAGYRGMNVEIKDDALFVDASERTMNGFLLKFEHLCGQNIFLAHRMSTIPDIPDDGYPDSIKAEFRFDNDQVIKMGLDLVEDLDGLVWFDRVEPGKEDDGGKRHVVVDDRR